MIEGTNGTVSRCRVGVTGVSDAGYRATAVERALEGQTFSAELAASAAEQAAAGSTPWRTPLPVPTTAATWPGCIPGAP